MSDIPAAVVVSEPSPAESLSDEEPHQSLLNDCVPEELQANAIAHGFKETMYTTLKMKGHPVASTSTVTSIGSLRGPKTTKTLLVYTPIQVYTLGPIHPMSFNSFMLPLD